MDSMQPAPAPTSTIHRPIPRHPHRPTHTPATESPQTDLPLSIASGYLLTPLPRCAILIDRHVHKNGGTTMRAVMQQNALLDGWAYWGYGLDSMPRAATALINALSSTQAGGCTSWHAWTRRSPLRILGELHYGNALPPLRDSLLAHFGPASPLRHAALRCACKVVLVTRLRDPPSFYRSFFKWAGLDAKQLQNPKEFGADMLQWAAGYRNLQSNLLLGQVRGWEWGGMGWDGMGWDGMGWGGVG